MVFNHSWSPKWQFHTVQPNISKLLPILITQGWCDEKHGAKTLNSGGCRHWWSCSTRTTAKWWILQYLLTPEELFVPALQCPWSCVLTVLLSAFNGYKVLSSHRVYGSTPSSRNQGAPPAPSHGPMPTCWPQCWGNRPSGSRPPSGRSGGWSAPVPRRRGWRWPPAGSRWSGNKRGSGWLTRGASAAGRRPRRTSVGEKRWGVGEGPSSQPPRAALENVWILPGVKCWSWAALRGCPDSAGERQAQRPQYCRWWWWW